MRLPDPCSPGCRFPRCSNILRMQYRPDFTKKNSDLYLLRSSGCTALANAVRFRTLKCTSEQQCSSKTQACVRKSLNFRKLRNNRLRHNTCHSGRVPQLRTSQAAEEPLYERAKEIRCRFAVGN